jgi:transmembrane 9 superfamily protein 2/4
MKSVLLAAAFAGADAFYLPGVAPRTFRYGDRVRISATACSDCCGPPHFDNGFSLCYQVELKVNKMASIHTQVPYDYYALRFCKPRGGVQQVDRLCLLFDTFLFIATNLALSHYTCDLEK